MSDLISRQEMHGDVINKSEVLETYAELYDIFDDNKEIRRILSKVYDKLNKLPSTQPEQTRVFEGCGLGGGTGDIIFKQDAMDALEKIEGCFPYRVLGERNTYSQYNEGWSDAICTAKSWIENMLPSAQSQRMRGRWVANHTNIQGDTWIEWKCNRCGYVRSKGWEHNGGEMPKAAICENCGAMMEGEQQ